MPMPLPSEVKGWRGGRRRRIWWTSLPALADETPETCWPNLAAAQFSAFKNALADLAVAKLAPIAEEIKRLKADPAYVEGVSGRWLEPRPRHRRPHAARSEEDRRLRGVVGLKTPTQASSLIARRPASSPCLPSGPTHGFSIGPPILALEFVAPACAR